MKSPRASEGFSLFMERGKGFELLRWVNSNHGTVHAFLSFHPSLPSVESSIRLPRLPHPSPGFSQRPGDIRETEAASPSVRLTSRDYAATTWRCPRPLVEPLALITMSTSWPRVVMNFRSRSMEKHVRPPSAAPTPWADPRPGSPLLQPG
jgi:hypothetical protein